MMRVTIGDFPQFQTPKPKHNNLSAKVKFETAAIGARYNSVSESQIVPDVTKSFQNEDAIK